MNQRSRGLGQSLIVTSESPLPTQPPEGPFHDPAPREGRKSLLAWGLAHDLQPQLAPFAQPAYPALERPGIGAVGPEQPQAPELCRQSRQPRVRSRAILDIRR